MDLETEILLSEEEWSRLAELLRDPGEPTVALRKLFECPECGAFPRQRHRDDCPVPRRVPTEGPSF